MIERIFLVTNHGRALDIRMKNPSIYLRWILALLLLVALIAPIILYIATFGTSLSHIHSRWSEAGDFIGGVYAPIVALLTLVIIVGQLFSQIHFNKHQIDQSFLNNSKSDLHYYIEQLDNVLRRHEQMSNVPLGHTLINIYSAKTIDELKRDMPAKDVKRITNSDNRICAMWGAIYTIFAGLKSCNETDYELVYKSSKQKCRAVFGDALCEALDNYHFVACNYPSDFPYEFSRAHATDL